VDYELRVIVEGIRDFKKSSSAILSKFTISKPTSGVRGYEEQISLLERVQNSVLAAQSSLTLATSIVQSVINGFAQSKFHAVFTDHKVGIQIQSVVGKVHPPRLLSAPLSIRI